MRHTHEPDAPLFQQPKPPKGFNFREAAKVIRPDVADKLGHPREKEIESAGKGREEFIAKARAFVLEFKPERRFTGEDAIDAAAVVGLVSDEHGIWGHVFNGLAREGRIVKTGEYRPRSNGNPTPVWRVSVYEQKSA